MGEWLAGLTGRQRVALLLYLVGLAMMLLSLPATFYADGSGATSTWRTIMNMGMMIFEDPEALMVDSWREMIEGPLPILFLLLSYLLVVPGILLLFLASRNAWFCWTGRLIWPLLFLAGPQVLLIGDGYTPDFLVGCWLWGLWVLLISAAHWVVAPRPAQNLVPVTGAGAGG